MTVRLATDKDIALLDGMLIRMGLLWSKEAIIEAMKEPWITVIHETAGVPDGFYVAYALYETTRQADLGPGDGPHESHTAWLKAICEMGIAIEKEEVRRHPKINPTTCWIKTRIWPDKMGPLNAFIEASFNWTPVANAGPVSGKEGYKVLPDNCREYWQKRVNLVAKAKTVLAALEKTA